MPSIPQLFLDRHDRDPKAVGFYILAETDVHNIGEPAPQHPGWKAVRFGRALQELSGIARRLYSLGVDKGVPVAILANTSHLWAAADLAILALGGVTVGIYPNSRPEEALHQLRHSGARVLLIEDAGLFAALQPGLDDLPELVHCFCFQEAGALLPRFTPASPDEAFLRARVAALSPDDVATHVYTSGTTGPSKAVVLTHRNFLATIESSRRAIPTEPGDRSVIFLPLAHSLQRFAVYRGLAETAVGYYAPTIASLPQVIAVARPQVLASVPRMLEKIKATAEARAAAKSAKAAEILAWAVQVGKAVNQLQRKGERVPLTLRTQHKLADTLVYTKVRQNLGGELRMIVSGGAALSVEVAEWFEALGISVREGWGLTETCAPATANRADRFRVGTVGLPLPGVSVKVDADGELLVRGPGNFSGYLHDPVATAAAFTPDGYFRTGDIGSVDVEGFVRILDRKKELIVTAGGKNIAPVPIEKALEGGPIGQAVVIGSERPYLVALLCTEPDVAHDEALRRAIAARVEEVNRGLARTETIKRWALLPSPLSVEGGELTPTLKLRRRVIIERHRAQIEALYAP